MKRTERLKINREVEDTKNLLAFTPFATSSRACSVSASRVIYLYTSVCCLETPEKTPRESPILGSVQAQH
jgi:hypothetical protein